MRIKKDALYLLYYVLTLLLVVIVANVSAQNLETVGKEKALRVTGGVSLNQILYGVKGIPSRRDPYTYYASGNLNFSLYGWNVPLSFSFSNQKLTYQQPFNRYSVHPTYKWVTGHFGYTSMSFSPYTVSGHVFLGGGVDLAPPGKFKFSALYGRFMKAVQAPIDTLSTTLPVFKRMGFGAKASYGEGNDFVNLILFHAQDQRTSVYAPDSILEQKDVLPQENLVMSVGAGKMFLEHFVVKGEIASSAISRDTRAETNTNNNPLGKMGFLYTPRTSSQYYKAIKGSFAYQNNGYSIGMGYERVDPQYRTLGAYYFNSDLENITANGAAALLHGKMTVAANVGTQRDNLDHSKVSTMRRLVSALNVGFAPSQRLNLSASYSNFTTYTNIRSQFQTINQLTPYENLDTLNFTQISQNATLTGMYQLSGNDQKRQSLSMNLTFQNAADKQGQVKQNSGAKFYNVNASYSLSLVPKKITGSLSFNANVSDAAAGSTKTLGPTLALSKSFLDSKLRGTFSTSYNTTYANGKQLSSIMNARIGGSMSFKKKHNVNLNLVGVNRSTKVEGASRSFSELTTTLGYSYSF